jgi:nitrogen fixation/metabolism regulation signal transduction histidine kinase
MKFEEDERQLLVSAIKSIDGIAQNLLDKNRPTSKHRARQSIKKILDHLVQRKNFYLLKNNYSNIKIEFEANPKNNEFLANLNESDFSRAIDNLLMNSIESVVERIKVDRETSEFKIIVQLKLNATQIEILISDQGSEIDHTTLERLQNKDFTFTTKQSGNGIGLNEVSRILQEHQADLSFSKNISGQGITAKIVVFSAA